jgi:hypothetical protein
VAGAQQRCCNDQGEKCQRERKFGLHDDDPSVGVGVIAQCATWHKRQTGRPRLGQSESQASQDQCRRNTARHGVNFELSDRESLGALRTVATGAQWPASAVRHRYQEFGSGHAVAWV